MTTTLSGSRGKAKEDSYEVFTSRQAVLKDLYPYQITGEITVPKIMVLARIAEVQVTDDGRVFVDPSTYPGDQELENRAAAIPLVDEKFPVREQRDVVPGRVMYLNAMLRLEFADDIVLTEYAETEEGTPFITLRAV